MVGYTNLLIGLISVLTYSCGSDKVINTVFTGASLPETPFADSTLGIANATGVAIHPDGRVSHISMGETIFIFSIKYWSCRTMTTMESPTGRRFSRTV